MESPGSDVDGVDGIDDVDAHRLGGLDEADLDPDPMVQFRRWYDEAVVGGVPEPEAMVLATADADGRPSARTVLLKGLDERGFRFFTNYDSRKAADLAINPACSLVFRWRPLDRQVCVTGRAERTSDEESDRYFATRPRGSRLGAWASSQSRVIAGRDVLDERLAELEARHPEGSDIPRPPHWGGFLVIPDAVEYWHGRPNRLHDRLRYSRTVAGGWRVERLSP